MRMSGRRVAVAGVICVGVLAAGILAFRPDGEASAAPTPTADASSNQSASDAIAVHTSTPTSILLTPEVATPKNTRTSSATATEQPNDDAPVVVGDGFSDVSPHQIVRTSDDILYVIVPDCDAYPDCPESRLHAYR